MFSTSLVLIFVIVQSKKGIQENHYKYAIKTCFTKPISQEVYQSLVNTFYILIEHKENINSVLPIKVKIEFLKTPTYTSVLVFLNNQQFD